MTHSNPWLPSGYPLPGNACCKRLLASGEDWQIYATETRSRVLLFGKELCSRWLESHLLNDENISALELGDREMWMLSSHDEYALTTVFDRNAPDFKSDALAFAAALKSTRSIDATVPLHDAIYVEELSRLLPTYSITPPIPDDVVLGSWLTGGVQISTKSRRRLHTFLSWMDRSDIDDVLARAGMAETAVSGSALHRAVSDTSGDQRSLRQTRTSESKRPTREATDFEAAEFHLPGRPDLEKLFKEHVIDIVRNPERYKEFGIGFPTAIALHGPPGCGKTYAVEKLVEFLDWPVFTIDSNTIGSPYIHETSKKVAEIFDKALDAAPSAIVIDEMESYLTDREGGGQSGLHHVEEVAEFLRRIPEANANRVLVIGMTNRIEMIDPAIMRRGRFDHVIEVGMPTLQEVSAALSELLANMPQDESIDITAIAIELAGRPMSDAAYVVREAGRNAARNGLQSLTQNCLLQALNLVPARTKAQKSKPIGFIWDE